MKINSSPCSTIKLLEAETYRNVIDLLLLQGKPEKGKIHLNIGCHYGFLAENLVEELDVHYVGLYSSVQDTNCNINGGIEFYQHDFLNFTTSYDFIKKIIGSRKLHSISIVDFLDKTPYELNLIQAVQKIAAEYNAFVVVSAPNITHSEIGLNLAFGRWDYIYCRLLSCNSLHFFDRYLFNSLLRTNGLHPINFKDVKRISSDQNSPRLHPALAHGSALHNFLCSLRKNIDDDNNTINFITICVAGPTVSELSVNPNILKPVPFLSIVIRTQGVRAHTLREALTSLAAQTDEDFEVVIVAHHVSSDRYTIIESIINDTPFWLKDKIRIILCDEGNRTRPLNVGFEAAAGSYITILDDDDMPKANWVETFRELASTNPGCLLRASCVRQDVENVTVNGKLGLRATGPLELIYPSEFDFIDHIRTNFTPPISIAFPSDIFHKLNIRFDETITTTEDWDFMMRVAGLVGVATSEKITAIYRWWIKDSSSRTVHSSEHWQQNYQSIINKFDDMFFLFPKGSTKRIRSLLNENDHLKSILNRYHIDINTGQISAPQDADLKLKLLSDIHSILNSNSWKVTVPVRLIGYFFGKKRFSRDIIFKLKSDELYDLFQKLNLSRSWRITKPLRQARKFLK